MNNHYHNLWQRWRMESEKLLERRQRRLIFALPLTAEVLTEAVVA